MIGDNPVRFAVISKAGLVAARRVSNEDYAELYATHDFMRMSDAFRALKIIPKVQRRIHRIAEKICERLVEDNWSKIQEVAEVLADRRILSGDEVRRIIQST